MLNGSPFTRSSRCRSRSGAYTEQLSHLLWRLYRLKTKSGFATRESILTSEGELFVLFYEFVNQCSEMIYVIQLLSS